MPSADGRAEVNSKRGAIEIEAEFGNLQKPTTFGNEYLTYILWAISPEGRAVNLGEVLVGGNSRSKLHVTTDLQAFALIVTAENNSISAWASSELSRFVHPQSQV